ncbi:MAG TPA: tubulin-like doman-containing protein, partial [Gemmataceae bacterium]|nr:tubulin-like doman-containing protein [Gemmataceae bacterium]
MAVRIEKHAEPIPGYRLIDRLGGGGFGEVWRAEAPGGLLKAIKFVYGDLQDMGDDGQRAEQELKALSRVKTVRHPYVLSLERFDILDGQLIIVTELADRNLWDRYKDCRGEGLPGIPRPELLSYLQEVAEALDLMNIEYGLQHLDIKPQNLFLVHQHIKVGDFGLVKDLEGMRASVTGGVTPVYAAPETFDGWVSRHSDQYSLAIVYQELLTGQRPFAGGTVRQLVMQHLQAQPNLASLPEAERPIIARSLAKHPDERYPTCKELIQALRQAGAPAAASSLCPEGREWVPPVTPGRNGLLAAAPVEREEDLADGSADPTHCLRGRDDTPRPVETAVPAREAPEEVRGEGALFPAVVVGVGELGRVVLQQLAAAVHRRFGSRDALPSLRLLLIDTDPGALKAATQGKPEEALCPQEVLLTPLNRPAHYLKSRDGRAALDSWLNQQMLYRIPRARLTMGVRALGRLALCDHFRAVTRRLRSELDACLAPEALATAVRETGVGMRSNRPRVYIVAGLAGGTGGGMFLDLAYILRAQLRQLGYGVPDVVGLFAIPDAGPAEANGAAEDARQAAHSRALGNTYAALTELTHFATPGRKFSARYHESEPPVLDTEPPFH